MNYLKALLQTFRPPFLILAPICVFLGLSTAIDSGAKINYVVLFILLLGAVLAHIAVNTLNEYQDFKSGLDFHTLKTPFSGGSGALIKQPEVARLVFITASVCIMLTISIGVYFMINNGTKILPIGVLGILLIMSYTRWLNRSPLLCLIAPGLGFGLLMAFGTHVLLTGDYSVDAFLISLIPFFLANNLLLLNQYPDVPADKKVGRRTFPIIYGFDKSNVIYLFFNLFTYGLIIYYIVSDYLPQLSIIALLPFILSLFSLMGIIRYSSTIAEHSQYLASNVAATLLTPLLLGVSIIYG